MNADCIWRSISIQYVQIEPGMNSDLGKGSFWVEIHDAKHLLTSRCTCRSTQVKIYTGLIASTYLWPQEMFTFLEMLALVESESSFGAYVCHIHRRPAGLRATSDLVFKHQFWDGNQCNWMATFIDYILISLDLKAIVDAHALCIDMISSDPEVSKCNQSRWPSNCTGFHGHHVGPCKAQWPIGYGVGLRIKRSSVRIRPWPLCWVLGQGSLLPLSQGEAFTLASTGISYLAILVKYILAKKKRQSLPVWPPTLTEECKGTQRLIYL